MKLKIKVVPVIDNMPKDELYIVGELFRELIDKFNKVRNKKQLYKGMEDLTVIEIDTIIVIGREGMKSMSSIAKQLGVSFGTPTVTIDRLIEKGYVKRIRDEEDRRQVFVKLSDKGTEVLESIISLKNGLTERIFGILQEDERTRLIDILSRLNSKFDEVFSTLVTESNFENKK